MADLKTELEKAGFVKDGVAAPAVPHKAGQITLSIGNTVTALTVAITAEDKDKLPDVFSSGLPYPEIISVDEGRFALKFVHGARRHASWSKVRSGKHYTCRFHVNRSHPKNNMPVFGQGDAVAFMYPKHVLVHVNPRDFPVPRGFDPATGEGRPYTSRKHLAVAVTSTVPGVINVPTPNAALSEAAREASYRPGEAHSLGLAVITSVLSLTDIRLAVSVINEAKRQGFKLEFGEDGELRIVIA